MTDDVSRRLEKMQRMGILAQGIGHEADTARRLLVKMVTALDADEVAAMMEILDPTPAPAATVPDPWETFRESVTKMTDEWFDQWFAKKYAPKSQPEQATATDDDPNRRGTLDDFLGTHD